MKRTSSGFTLIELLVVIAIIGLLSTLAVVALNSARLRSRDAKRVSDIKQLQTALELGFTETSSYPAGTSITLGSTNARVLCNVGGSASFVAAATSCTGDPYMQVPSNPTPNGASYVYTSASGSGAYQITFSLEGATGQYSAGANCANQNGVQAGSSC